MPRPRKHRRLLREPHPFIFKPVGLPLESVDQVTLLHEELEALRLADLEGLHQKESAQHMGISRSTFQRMLTEARRKVALALANGAALHVKGGTFHLAGSRWHCTDCGHDWDQIHGSGHGPPQSCPACGSPTIRERQPPGRRHLE